MASRLLTALLAEARRQRIRVVVLETTVSWTDARSLYEAHGFVLDRVEDGLLGRDAHYTMSLSEA